jgi:2-polyprenyl-3-methyl-5-hydroxy-6-metoxy-1,4-benzoquinol methylase
MMQGFTPDSSKPRFSESDSDFYDLEYYIGLEYRYFSGAHQSRIRNILKTIGQVEGLRCLDIGCGGGYFTNELNKAGANVIGVDYSKQGVEFAKKRFPSLQFRDMSAYSLTSFSPESFDVVTLIDVIEHLGDPQAVVSTVYTLLKPGGRIAISTDVANSAWSKYPLNVLIDKSQMLSADGRAYRLIAKAEEYRRGMVKDYHITHISLLSDKALFELLTSNHFKVVKHAVYPLVGVPLRDFVLRVFPKAMRGDHQCIIGKKMAYSSN